MLLVPVQVPLMEQVPHLGLQLVLDSVSLVQMATLLAQTLVVKPLESHSLRRLDLAEAQTGVLPELECSGSYFSNTYQ